MAQQYQTLQSQVQKIDQLQQTQFQGLNNKVNQLFAQTLNQSHAVDTVKMATTSVLTRLQTAETDVKTAKDNLDKFQKKVEPEVLYYYNLYNYFAFNLVSHLTEAMQNLPN